MRFGFIYSTTAIHHVNKQYSCIWLCREEWLYEGKGAVYSCLKLSFRNVKFKKSLFTSRNEDNIHKQSSESFSFAKLNGCYQSFDICVSVSEHVNP